MHKRFASLQHSDELGYAYDSAAMDSRAPVEANFRVFQTYGHDLVQHSPDWSVTIEQLEDYLWSLAAALLEDSDLGNRVRICFGMVDVKDIAFAATVKHNADKPMRYYNLRERRISSKEPTVKLTQAETWAQIHDWADGSAKSIFRIVTPDWAKGMMQLSCAVAVYDWCFDDTANRPYMEQPVRFLDWTKDSDAAGRLHAAYVACTRIIAAQETLAYAQRALDNHKDWIERKKGKAA